MMGSRVHSGGKRPPRWALPLGGVVFPLGIGAALIALLILKDSSLAGVIAATTAVFMTGISLAANLLSRPTGEDLATRKQGAAK